MNEWAITRNRLFGFDYDLEMDFNWNSSSSDIFGLTSLSDLRRKTLDLSKTTMWSVCLRGLWVFYGIRVVAVDLSVIFGNDQMHGMNEIEREWKDIKYQRFDLASLKSPISLYLFFLPMISIYCFIFIESFWLLLTFGYYKSCSGFACKSFDYPRECCIFSVQLVFFFVL